MIVQLKSDNVVELLAPRTDWSPVLSTAGPGRVASDRVGPGRVDRAGSGRVGSGRVRSASIV